MTDQAGRTPRLTALRITAIYLAVGALWIVASDRLVATLADTSSGSPAAADPLGHLTDLQTLKGIFFVVSTGLMLYLLIARGMRTVRAADERLRDVRATEEARYQDLANQASDEAARSREAQQRLEDQLRQSQKMEAIGLLAGGVAHDFNNLLVAISGYAELALAHVPAGNAAREEVDGIRQAVERGAGLARQLLALSRRQVLEPAPLDLNAVLVDLGRMLPRVLGRQVELSLRTEAQPSTIMADLSQVEQLVLNLCVNARDAMPEGGKLLIQTMSVPAPGARGTDGPDAAGDGHRIALIVTDTGAGMDAGTRERIFEPFFSTKPTGQGTGLGLATVYAIVQQSCGTIACSSAPERGTSFRIEFPLASGAESVAAVPAPLQSTESVLLVEGDPCALETSERGLLRHGYQVLAAADMASAEALAATHEGPLHVLVARADLTAGPGAAAFQRLRSAHPKLGVLLVTGRTPPPPSTDAPGTALLAMPFTSLELAAAVRRVIAEGGRTRASAAAPAAVPAIAVSRPVAHSGLTVLVADDDSQVCRVVREMLETAGHSVIVAANGAEALAVLRATPVDVVLCDMLMPEKEGLETCTEMRRRHPELPFLAMSGAPGGSNYMRIAMKLGATGSLSKPFSQQDLLLAIDRALGVRQER